MSRQHFRAVHYLYSMLTFFRQIRKGLLDMGAGRKYLLYAIGEILLVMVGILLALQVNNWNEVRTNTRKENDLMRVIYKELENTDEYLTSRIENLTEGIDKNGKEILQYTKSGRKDVKIDSISHHLISIFYIGGFAPQASKFQQVIGGEGLDLISFDSLQILFIQYQNHLELAHNHDLKMQDRGELEAFWNKHLVVHTILRLAGHNWHDLFEGDSASSFAIDLDAVISKPEFENIIVNRLMLLHSARRRLFLVQRHIETMLSFIDQHYKF